MGWFAYAAMAAGLLPLGCMAVGYLYISLAKQDEDDDENDALFFSRQSQILMVPSSEPV